MADALDSGSSGSNTVWVQVPSSAPRKNPCYDTTGIFSWCNDVCLRQMMLLRSDGAALMMCA